VNAKTDNIGQSTYSIPRENKITVLLKSDRNIKGDT
jgi:hypothetical protein